MTVRSNTQVLTTTTTNKETVEEVVVLQHAQAVLSWSVTRESD